MATAPAKPRIPYDEDYESILHEGLQRVLPPVLVQSTTEASGVIAPVTRGSLSFDEFASLAAALGSTAASPVAHALRVWIGKQRLDAYGHRWPVWLRPAIAGGVKATLATLTDFSQKRSQYIKEVEGGTPILLTRHGSVIAAVIPLQPGAYEQTVLQPALEELLEVTAEGIELTSEQADEIRRSDNPAATAAMLGINTAGWGALNPPHSDRQESEEVPPPEGEVRARRARRAPRRSAADR